MSNVAPQSNIMYLRKQLNFTMPEWSGLSDKDKADLRRYASEEMAALGIPESAAKA